MPFSSQRPTPAERHFTSDAVERTIRDVTARIADDELAWLFSNCFPNTLDTTVQFGRDAKGRPDTFVITGDIDAMWLRDSTNQVWPYLSLAHQDEKLKDLLRGVINRQAACVRFDPYANAFNRKPTDVSDFKDDRTAMRPGLHERKYELDSLCAVLRLACGYFDATGDSTCFDDDWLAAVGLILDTITTEQAGSDESKSAYRFQRETFTPLDTLANDGLGSPFRRTGMSRSAFRPSDDATTFQYLVPSNAMAVACLRDLDAMLNRLKLAPALAQRARSLSAEIEKGILEHGLVSHAKYGRIFAFEVDGFGSSCLMDDANVPSLLSLPYLRFCKPDDATYLATRKFVLSDDNPYFASGKAARGIGGPHTGIGRIWPISIIIRAMTSSDEAEIIECLGALKSTHAGSGFMHEAFWKDDPAKYSRKWFAWANTLFGELIVKLERERPELLQRKLPATRSK